MKVFFCLFWKADLNKLVREGSNHRQSANITEHLRSRRARALLARSETPLRRRAFTVPYEVTRTMVGLRNLQAFRGEFKEPEFNLQKMMVGQGSDLANRE